MPDWIILLAEGATQPSPGGQIYSMAVTVGAAMLVFYLILWRPQAKKEKERQEQLQNVKKNDRVLTTGGIYGVVKFVDDKEVLLRVDDENKVVIRFAKSAIVGIERPGGEGAGETK